MSTFRSVRKNAVIVISTPLRETTGLSTDLSMPSRANGTWRKPLTTFATQAFQRFFSAAERRRFFRLASGKK
jgi:hypothetical protein